MNYAIYLRKSRADAELERQGEGETLARHKAALMELAHRQNLNVTHIYEEIVSGESIVSRPQMQELMQAVENGQYAGVLVMEIERLARGDTIDQGLVAQTFKYSGTKIITPFKTYDPANDIDEEYFEFGLFMSRREYKTINRRLKQGLYASAKEGKWLSPIPPYGYKRVPLTGRKGTTLEPIKEQADVVRLIFDLYVNGIDGRRLGLLAIAVHLNNLHIPPPKADYWQSATIRAILNNPAYAGKLRYGYRKAKKRTINGTRKTSHPVSDEYQLVDGLHPAIISYELYQQAQGLAASRPIMPVGYKKEIQNPLSGLVLCKLCGRKMTIRKPSNPNRPAYLICPATACPNVSAPISIVEERLIFSLAQWMTKYELQIGKSPSSASLPAIDALISAKSTKEKELETLTMQLSSAYDYFEQGTYTPDVFTQRIESINARICAVKSDIDILTKNITVSLQQEQLKAELVPRVKTILQVYREAATPALQNSMLREILDKAVYFKAKSASRKGVSPDDFELDIFPKLPE